MTSLDPRVIEAILSGRPIVGSPTADREEGREPAQQPLPVGGSSDDRSMAEIGEEIQRLAKSIPESRIDMVALARACLGVKP